MVDRVLRDHRTEARRLDALAVCCLAGLAVVLYLLLPGAGDIWWMDASRHALNGAFVLDFCRTMPWHDPLGFALDYYRQWPALTILFYPPLFYVFLAASYAVLGVSEAAALVPELAALFLLSLGSYRLARNWLSFSPALAVAVLVIGAPEVCFWGRQVMLDIPAYAFLAWAAVFHIRYLRQGRPLSLYVAAACVVAAAYTKYNAAFLVVPIGISLVVDRGWRAVFAPAVLKAMAGAAVLLVPLVFMFARFASYDLSQAASLEGSAARWSWTGLTFYAHVMPEVLSWPVCVLAVLTAVLVPFNKRLRLPRAEAALLLAWVGFGYFLYSMIAVKEPRHILTTTFPLVFGAVLILDRMLPRRVSTPACLVLAGSVLITTLLTRPAPYVTGLAEAAREVARVAPADTNVAIWARLDGSFIFAMRAYGARPDLGVVRLDKLLLSDVVVDFDRGYSENTLSVDEIIQRLHDLHVQYVVIQPTYADGFPVVRRLLAAVQSERFTEVGRISMSANYRFSDVSELVIYKAVQEVPHGRVAPPLNVGIIGKSF